MKDALSEATDSFVMSWARADEGRLRRTRDATARATKPRRARGVRNWD
jgi:hypothetical protein